MADAAVANTGAAPTRPSGWHGIAADWSLIGQWQKAWTDVMGFWAKAGKADDTAGPRRRF